MLVHSITYQTSLQLPHGMSQARGRDIIEQLKSTLVLYTKIGRYTARQTAISLHVILSLLVESTP